jgi:hypothetical protein
LELFRADNPVNSNKPFNKEHLSKTAIRSRERPGFFAALRKTIEVNTAAIIAHAY